jgi:uncharacterized membrane protein
VADKGTPPIYKLTPREVFWTVVVLVVIAVGVFFLFRGVDLTDVISG